MNEHKYIDLHVLQKMHWEDVVEGALAVGAFEALFDIRESSYKEVTLEVLSTLTVDVDLRICLPNVIKFRVGGQPVTLDMNEFFYTMSIYTYDFKNGLDYANLVISSVFLLMRIIGSKFLMTINHKIGPL